MVSPQADQVAADGIDHLALRKARFQAGRTPGRRTRPNDGATMYTAEVAMEASTVVFEADSDTLIDCTTGEIAPREHELVIDEELPTKDGGAMQYKVTYIESYDERFAQHEAFQDPDEPSIAVGSDVQELVEVCGN